MLYIVTVLIQSHSYPLNRITDFVGNKHEPEKINNNIVDFFYELK